MKSYANELDERRFEFRRRTLIDIVQRAKVLRDDATDVDETLEKIEEFRLMIKDLAVEVRPGGDTPPPPPTKKKDKWMKINS